MKQGLEFTIKESTIKKDKNLIEIIADKVLKEISPDMINAIAKKILENAGSVNDITSNVRFTTNEAAKICDTTQATISRHIRDGLLIANKTGKSYSITQTNLNNYINGK